jgi:hypothetical protein
MQVELNQNRYFGIWSYNNEYVGFRTAGNMQSETAEDPIHACLQLNLQWIEHMGTPLRLGVCNTNMSFLSVL